MKNKDHCRLLLLFLLFLTTSVFPQEIRMTETASLRQAYEEEQQSQRVLSMNDSGMDKGGYLLYETEITVTGGSGILSVENIRDYGTVFVDGNLQGELSDEKKELPLQLQPGRHSLQIYTENIGRITYGPEILDNSKGLWGAVTFNGEEVEGWTMIPLKIRDLDVSKLNFKAITPEKNPCFFKGRFPFETPRDIYLNVSGWGMGEIWVNGTNVGTYWEKEFQQSVKVPADVLKSGENEVIVFELKNTRKRTMSLSDEIIFR